MTAATKSRAKTPPAATRQIKRGRGHSYICDGEPAPGATKVLGDGIPKPALVNWAARVTAAYAVDHWDELSEKTASARLKELEGARYATSGAAMARGTEVHALAERMGRGEEVEVDEHLAGFVDAYLDFTERFGVEELLIERVVVKRTPWGPYMGQFDLVARLTALDPVETWLLDWKTNASGIFPETALQLASYADADTYLDDDGNEQPMPKIDRLGAVWLRADGADLIPVIAEPEGELPALAVFQYAMQIARFTSAPRGTYLGPAIQVAS